VARRKILRQSHEHFNPGRGTELQPYLDRGDQQAVHHLLRYHWAIAVLRQDPPARLIDVACGTGYGTRMLGEALPDTEVIGVDLDAEGIRQARTFAVPGNVTFRVGDVQSWVDTIDPDPVDAVTTFDTLEHIPHRELMMMSLARQLTPTGRVLLSTPVRGDGPRLTPTWRHHRIEYSPATLYDFLRRYFAVVQRPEDGSLPCLDVFDCLHGTSVDYLLRMNPVVCAEPIVIAD
jgi:2-polyprenyl-3-methyl-5-hydroxy-6-metoxy-1,4-benzoquinol methylase